MGLDVFENYECDGQIEISNLKGERMDKLIYIPADQIHMSIRITQEKT